MLKTIQYICRESSLHNVITIFMLCKLRFNKNFHFEKFKEFFLFDGLKIYQIYSFRNYYYYFLNTKLSLIQNK
jgi:hypothetical protein